MVSFRSLPWRPASSVLAVGLLTFGLVAGHAQARLGAPRSLAEQIDLVREHSEILFPDGADDPVPAVILLHGCGGLRAVQPSYAATLRAAGFAVITVDSNGARGIGRFGAMTQVCTALRLWGQARAADLTAAVALAGDTPGIDADRLAVIGWSHGGWTLLEALSYAGEDRLPPGLASGTGPTGLPGLRAAIAVYPYCGFPVRATGDTLDRDIPLHAILAGRDLIADPDDCIATFNRAEAAGRPVSWSLWPDVTHAFDEPNQPRDPRMEYDAEAAARARARVVEILSAELTR